MFTESVRARLVRPLAANALYLGVVCLGAYYFTQLRFSFTSSGGATLEALVSGTAPTPFQYRVLIPWLVRGLLTLLPSLSLPGTFQFIELLAVIGLVLAFRTWLKRLLTHPTLAALLSLSIFYALPFHFLFPREFAFFYPSDIPAVLFFTLGLLFLHRQDWKRFYPLLLLATLNRETALFLTVVYVFTAFGTRPRRAVIVHTLAQLALWGAAKASLYVLYRSNPGLGIFESQLASNLAWLSQPAVLIEVASLWGFVWIPVLIWGRSIPDDFVRRSLWAALPYVLALGTVGVVHEMRIYAEFIPLMLGAFWLIVVRLAQGQPDVSGPTATAPPARSETRTTPSRGSGIWIALSLLALTGALAALYVWSDWQANQSIEPVRASILASAQSALTTAPSGQRIAVINWPESLRTPGPARLLGLVPFTPTALRLPRPEAELLQYLPWQAGEGNGARLYYTGRIVTESELRATVFQSERVLDFHAPTSQIYTLMERQSLPSITGCRARYGETDGVCLVEAVATQSGTALRLDLVWRITSAQTSDVTVFVHVLADDGTLSSQADGDLVHNLIALANWPSEAGALRETRWAQAPPGAYVVRVGLYDRLTGERWPAACEAGEACGADGLTLRPALSFP
jgi:hypothetical protein